MANQLAMAQVRRVDTLGVMRSISGANKLTLAPRRHQLQRMRRPKPVAVATPPQLPADRPTKEAEKGSPPPFRFWEKTPAEHFKDYVESTLPPGPSRKYYALRRTKLVAIFWLSVVPLSLWICPWTPFTMVSAFAFTGAIYYGALIFNWFCGRRIWQLKMNRWEMKNNGR